MEIVQTLNFRGMEELFSKSKNVTFYKYYFENEKGVSQSFISPNKILFERNKNYNLRFGVSKMYFLGVVDGK